MSSRDQERFRRLSAALRRELRRFACSRAHYRELAVAFRKKACSKKHDMAGLLRWLDQENSRLNHENHYPRLRVPYDANDATELRGLPAVSWEN